MNDGEPSTSNTDIESGHVDETQPLLQPEPDSYRRKRRISLSFPNREEPPKKRFYFILAAVFLAVAAVIGTVLGFALHPRRRSADDIPDFSKLRPPQPGIRNPSYLLSGSKGAVATEVDICSRVGLQVLKDGGNAVDAGISASLCVGVVNMFSSGIGGGGFMVIRPSTNESSRNPLCQEPITINFREAAPSQSWTTMFSSRPNQPDFDPVRASRVGGLAVAVPGELRGFEEAYRLCGGGVSWERIFRPSIDLARETVVGTELGRRLDIKAASEWMLEYPEWREVFAPEGTILKTGDTIKRITYARTLDTIAKEGADAFYTGSIADALVETVQKAGGILTHVDLSSYRAIVRPALKHSYRNRTLYTSEAPGGGPALVALLNIVEQFGDEFVNDGHSALSVHRFVEALKFAFAARTEIGDPEFIHNDAKLAEIQSKGFARRVRANITDEETHPISYYNPHYDVIEDHGTTHISVVDQYNAAVAITTTVNLWYGSRIMDSSTGIILNDEMDDFSTPGMKNAFGLQPSPFNYPEPNKRPLSSTTPVIMENEDGSLHLTMGGSGGSRIFSAVAQVILNLDWGMDINNAIEQPRVHSQLLPDHVSIEGGYRPDLVNELKNRGHNISLFDINLGMSEVQAIHRRARDGRLFTASDSRKHGIPAAY